MGNLGCCHGSAYPADKDPLGEVSHLQVTTVDVLSKLPLEKERSDLQEKATEAASGSDLEVKEKEKKKKVRHSGRRKADKKRERATHVPQTLADLLDPDESAGVVRCISTPSVAPRVTDMEEIAERKFDGNLKSAGGRLQEMKELDLDHVPVLVRQESEKEPTRRRMSVHVGGGRNVEGVLEGNKATNVATRVHALRRSVSTGDLERRATLQAVQAREESKKMVRLAEESEAESEESETEAESAAESEAEKPKPKPKPMLRRSESLVFSLGREASASLQLMVENPRNIRDVYDLALKPLDMGVGFTKRVRSGKEATEVTEGTVKATGAVRIVKSIKKQVMKETFGSALTMIKTEVRVTKMVDHPNIIKLYEIFEDPLNIHLVVERCAGSTLHFRVAKHGKLSEKDTAVAMQQILRAVLYLHNNNICHRDVRPANILLATTDVDIAKNRLKLCDFGVSCIFEHGQILRAKVGTPEFMSPQVLKKSYTAKADIWSCGVVMYAIFTSKLPFAGESYADLNKNIMGGGKFRADWEAASESMIQFVSSLLTLEEENRMDAKEAARSEWIAANVTPPKNAALLKAELYTKLVKFKNLNKFTRASMCLIASYLSKSQIKGLEDAFHCLDKDGDGMVSAEECKFRIETMLKTLKKGGGEYMALKKALIQVGKDDFVEELFGYTEFVAATFDRKKNLKDDICKAAFSAFDQDGNGSVSYEELCSGSLLGDLKPKEIEKMVAEWDINHDGEVDLEEFTKALRTEK